MKCEECNDTGMIETETIKFGRYHYSEKHKGLVQEVIHMGDWAMTVCPCKSDD